MGIVPYIMPGFALAKKAAEVFEANPRVGPILHKHGIFTFGESAREAYERMIEMVSLAEARLRRGESRFVTAQLPQQRGSRRGYRADRARCLQPPTRRPRRLSASVLDFRTNAAVLNFVNGAEVAATARRAS